jgi:hypothetical protein
MSTAPLDECRGALVRDTETGFVGELVDVVRKFADPERMSPPQDVVFIRPRGGGVERTANPAMVRVLESTRAQSCTHPRTVRRRGKTYCASCDRQLYL